MKPRNWASVPDGDTLRSLGQRGVSTARVAHAAVWSAEAGVHLAGHRDLSAPATRLPGNATRDRPSEPRSQSLGVQPQWFGRRKITTHRSVRWKGPLAEMQ